MTPRTSAAWRAWRGMDQKTFTGIGGFLLAMAVLLTVREIDIGFGYTLAGVALVSSALSLRGPSERARALGLSGALAAGLLASLLYVWLIPYRIGAYLLAPTVVLVTCLIWLSRLERARRAALAEGAEPAALIKPRLVWVSLAGSLLVVSWAGYHQFLAYGLLEDVPLRRLLLSVFWLGSGLILYVVGRVKREGVVLGVGVLFVALALVKVWMLDTQRLTGYDRIVNLAAAGLLMLLGSLALKRRLPPPAPEPAEESEEELEEEPEEEPEAPADREAAPGAAGDGGEVAP